MSVRSLSAFLIGAALGAAAMPVFAMQCYEVIDRGNTVIYRATQTPVDLSAAGAPLRDAMYKRGEQLVIFDIENCVVIERSTTGSRTLTTDEIVAGWKSFGSSGFGGTYGSAVATGSGGGIYAPTPTNTGPTPAAQGAAAARAVRY